MSETYRYVDAALIRAAALPSGLVLPAFPEASGNRDVDADRWHRWIGQVWAVEPVAQAIELASPVLARRAHHVVGGRTLPLKQLRRTALSLYRYVLRFQHRSTPFGLFAGIAPARFGPDLVVRWGEGHRPTAGVDAVWLADVIAQLETSPELLYRLHVTANPTCRARDGRLVIPFQRPGHHEARGPGEVSVRYTPAVRTVVDAACSPVPVGEVAEKLRGHYPGTATAVVRALVTELVARRFLLTSLHPPMTTTDALGHLVGALDAVDAESIGAVAPVVGTLRQIRARLAEHADAAPADRRRSRASLIAMMEAQSQSAEQPLTVDLRLDCSLVLPEEVAREAETAASALARSTPYPFGSRSWQDYHDRFLERYGPGALVPLAHLTDPARGLDFPAGYRGSPYARPVPVSTERDERVLRLAQHAALDGAREVVVDDALLDGLSAGADSTPLPHLDLRFHLQAGTRDALRRGDFTLVVNGLTPAAGVSAGRFLPLLDAADRDRMTSAYAALPTLSEGAIRAQVSSPPLQVRTENVARHPAVWADVISVGEHRAEATLPLEDLAVTADAARMYLVSLSTGKPVEPVVLNAVDLAKLTHPLARLLCELPRARATAFGPFAWGAAERLPFLPRVRYGRAILAPATWRITATDLPGPQAPPVMWHDSLTAQRHKLRLPAIVHIGDSDQRLRLNLEHNADAELLRSEVDRQGHATLREAPEDSAYGWFAGRAHEITLALTSTRPPARPLLLRTAEPVREDHGHLPGPSRYAFAKLYGPPDHLAQVLTAHVPRLWDDWGTPPPWWFVRYRDPDDHIRLRVRLPRPADFGNVAATIGDWAADLRQRGLIGHVQWDTYYPETGRYGSPAALTAAETAFAADSAAAQVQMTLTAAGRAHPQALTAASLVDLATSFAGSAAAGMHWLIDHVTVSAAPHPARPLHREAVRLSNPDGGFAALRQVPGGDQVIAAWTVRREALATYRAQLAGDGAEPETVLSSLLHMHHLRAAGTDQAGEATCFRLARSAALTWSARSEGAAP